MSLVGVKLTTSEWERRSAHMQKNAIDDEPLSNIGTVYEAAPRPRWTTQPPAKPGLYFCKLIGGYRRVVEVYEDDHRRLFASWTDIDEFSITRPGMLWSDRELLEPV
jgi:hypothetical protein